MNYFYSGWPRQSAQKQVYQDERTILICISSGMEEAVNYFVRSYAAHPAPRGHAVPLRRPVVLGRILIHADALQPRPLPLMMTQRAAQLQARMAVACRPPGARWTLPALWEARRAP